jgi:hypothetical protein
MDLILECALVGGGELVFGVPVVPVVVVASDAAAGSVGLVEESSESPISSSFCAMRLSLFLLRPAMGDDDRLCR